MSRFIPFFAVLALVSLRAAAPERIDGMVFHESGRGLLNQEVGLGLMLNPDATLTQIYFRIGSSPLDGPGRGNSWRLSAPTNGTWSYAPLPSKPDTFPAGLLTLRYTGNSTATTLVLNFESDLEGIVHGSVTVGGHFVLSRPTPFPLSNSSSRVSLISGGIARSGFVVNGGGERSVLLRAIGPGLAAFGITHFVRNPSLRVFSGSGTLLAENADWGSESTAAVSRLNTIGGAFPLAMGSKDAVVFLRLPPGSYVVEAKSTGPSDEGEILVEVFMLP